MADAFDKASKCPKLGEGDAHPKTDSFASLATHDNVTWVSDRDGDVVMGGAPDPIALAKRKISVPKGAK